MDGKVREALELLTASHGVVPADRINAAAAIRAHIEGLEAFQARCVGTYKGAPILLDDPGVSFVMVNKAQLDALQAQVRELEADAARYRWLRDNCKREWSSDMEHDRGAPSLDIEFEANGHDLDAAIDSATQENRDG